MIEWLGSNQLLFSLVLLPIVSILVAVLSSRYSTRVALAAQVSERVYNNASQVSNFRKAWIDDLRDGFSDFLTFCSVSHLQRLTKDPEKVIDNYRDVLSSANNIKLRMNPDDEDGAKLISLIEEVISGMPARIEAKRSVIDHPDEISLLMQKILKREWERIKLELNKSTL
ncbi:MAG: hypothetical protein ABJR46_04065 [Tateyamaria sp.]|uniref:hypothetical protein n=1 Tax=Tateyamaria sp. TaxID=1929288 RepID=UPI00329AFF9A